MTGECERCNGDGTIEADVADLLCPNCHDDVCQWCNTRFGRFTDAEELGDTGLYVCRSCIRDMATYKEDAVYALHVAYEIDNHVDDAEALQAALHEAMVETFAVFGVDIRDGDGWDVRPPDGGSE